MPTTPRLEWRTSSFTDNGQSCVEVAPQAGAVHVRDTKDHGHGPELVLTPDAFAALCAAATGAPDPMVRDEPRRTVHDGRAVATRWHVTAGRVTLHYTDAEWTAFAAGVRAGEFTFVPA